MRSIPAIIVLALAVLAPTVRQTPHDPQDPREQDPRRTLADDGRVATVSDLQGIALVRPVGRERWTPLGAGSVLEPGDLVRAPVRGANAVELRLPGGGSIVLGPGAMVELPGEDTVRLFRGDVELSGKARARGPGDFERAIAAGATAVLRSDGRGTEVLEDAPRWLTGYRASTTDEWMGSLVAQVDGRAVPLSVGYHKVTVDVRDQIARTTVEQSFVNATKSTLEGVFYFPLPADASISGFGMWIGDELVEADIVEKQRARAIYEDILRRRKDPGLLEWSGGNLFKARVFPIFPHSEKRIRIRYTQVLPLEGSTVRYRYGLRSELLRARPLQRLRLDVRISSAMPIRDVSSPSHEVRVRKTAHAAAVEFDAEEFTPERDFEVRIELDRSRALTVVPHRRDDDGYFMLLLSPPDPAAGGWQRELMPDGDPLDVLFVADTSGSMDPAAREMQAAFLGATLALLGPDDRFRLLACDVDAHWLVGEPGTGAAPVTNDNVARALDALDRRASLGWTDLDRAFGELASVAPGDGTTVIYVGDGIGTTGDADPVALGQRLRALDGSGATFHAVSTASTYEQVVLDAIASVGGGSVRAVGDDPAGTAFGLLAEVARPAVKDLQVRFEGLRTARVYPERLPNLPAGRQQVVLGRFLPAGGAGAMQRGQVVVTGTLDGERVRYTAELELAADEQGNSFVPRLWARRHVDALLEEGRTPELQEQVVAFSEEFGIMTPYTSFLVLENDADRERYGVQRRVKMRDGEAFFAVGRDRAANELLAQQIRRARSWRLELRARMLRELATLGEHLHAAAVATVAGGRLDRTYGAGAAPGNRDLGRKGYARNEPGKDQAETEAGADSFGDDFNRDDDPDGRLAQRDGDAPASVEEPDAEPAAASDPMVSADEDDVAGLRSAELQGYAPRPSRERLQNQQLAQTGAYAFDYRSHLGGGQELRQHRHGAHPHFGSYRFPHLPPPAPEPPPEVAEPDWSDEVWALLRGLDRKPALLAMAGGVQLSLITESLNPLRGHTESRQRVDGLLSGHGWLVRTLARDQEPFEQWLFDGERGVLAAGVRLGRKREAAPSDAAAWPFPLRDLSLTDVARAYHVYAAAVEEVDADTAAVILATGDQRYRLTIDKRRRVLLQSQTRWKGELRQTTRFGDFVEVGGQWWAREVVRLDHAGRTVQRDRLELAALDRAAFAKTLQGARSEDTNVIFVGPVDPELAASKQAVHDERAGFAEHFAVALHFVASGQWDRAWAAWADAEKAVAGKPGAFWLRAALMAQSRRGEDLKQLLRGLADELAGGAANAAESAAPFLAQHVLGLAGNVFQANEMLGVLEVLQPVFLQGGEDAAWRAVSYRRLRARWLHAAGQPDRARALHSEIAQARPFELQAVSEYLNALQQVGDQEAAIRFVAESITNQQWSDNEANNLYQRWTQLLWNRRQMRELSTAVEAWVARAPEQETAYQRWLSVLLFLDRRAETDAWVASRVAAGLPDGSSASQRAELGAAIQHALGHGWNFWHNRVDEKWYAPLCNLARRLIREDASGWYYASRILGDGRIQRTDEYAALQRALLADLSAAGAIEDMPVDRLGRYVQWIPWSKERVDADVWRAVTDRVRARWAGAEKDSERQVLAGFVLALLDGHGERTAAIDFLRARLRAASRELRPQVATQLLNRLVHGGEWSEAAEDEILALVVAVQPKEATEEQRRNLAAATIRWVAERLYRMRYAALLGPASDYEELPRAELRQKQKQARADARRGLATRLATARDGASDRARPWFELEHLCLLARLGERLKDVDGEVRELFFAVAADSGYAVDRVLRERCAYVVAFVATRPGAPEGLADGAVAFLEGLVGRDAPAAGIDWRDHLFRLLVVLDRPDQLAGVLRDWIVASEVASGWRIALGYLKAETGDLDAAVTVFEEVQRLGELGARELGALADWYLALGDEVRREQALLARYRAMPEWQLQNRLQRDQNRLARHGEEVPEEFDPDTLRVLEALLQKASHPAHHVWQVQNLYRTIKDHRVLKSLADGVVGHTAQGIYPFLEHVGSVVAQVHEEATCDALVERIAAVGAERAARDVDRRALLLLTALVERRAAEVLNAPGPHIERSLAAMRAAFRGAWLPGERRLMASFLASLGAIGHEALAAEQLRQLDELWRGEDSGTLDRLWVALFRDRTLWAYGRHDEAVDGLTAALDEFRKAQGGALTAEAQQATDTLVGWFESRQHYGRAERLLLAELRVQEVRSLSDWLRQRLFQVYVRCLDNGGSVSIGRGVRLYRAAREAMRESMFEHGADQVAGTLGSFCQLHEIAQREVGARDAGSELERFAHDELPELLPAVPGNASSLVSTVAHSLRRLRGPRSALALLIERIEAEPEWYASVNQGGWRHFAYDLGRWRSESGALGDLGPRLLRIVLRELDRDLESMQAHNRVIYQIHNHWFWTEQHHEFLTVALRVIEENPDSPARLLYAAEYLWGGLDEKDRAIATLAAAERRGANSENGRLRLVTWLHEVRRFEESLPLCEKLTEERPDRLDYRGLRITALHELGRDAEALAYVAETEERWKRHEQWSEPVIAMLAHLCLQCAFHERSAAYYEELIPLHQRTHARRGVGGGTLSSYYGWLAQAYVALGKVDAAVDAASAAVVSWGRGNQNRQGALHSLRSVIAGIEDLDGYAARYAAKAQGTGMDAPVIRKAIGLVYQQKRQHARAVEHLTAARALQPNDKETHAALVSAYDDLGRTREAIRALYESTRFDPMNLQLFADLGERLAKAGDGEESERAWTNLVEVLPNEADSHRQLAQHRERQRRFNDAVVQWRQVVRVRSDEPEGFLSLAAAQIRAKDRDAARETLQHVIDTRWDERFGDVKQRAGQMLQPLSRPPR